MKSSASGSSKFGFVQRVLSRTSSRNRSASKSSATSPDPAATAAGMEHPKSSTTPRSSAKFQSELLLLRSQIESLQISVHQMQGDIASKERALADAVREKEQLSVDLKKQRRANASLRQQLEDERGFYFKEKEQYCHEMNNAKRQRQHLSAAGDAEGGGAPIEALSAQKEIAELHNTLNQTLEANYNLSVKFLRMKNTKLGLKQQLAAAHGQHEESTRYCRAQVEEMRTHLDSLVQQHIFKPIPPSSKKYLHLLKSNAAVMHENLQLQMEVDRLHEQIGRLSLAEVRHEANSKLKLIHHDACPKCKLRADRDTSRTNSTAKTARSVMSRASQTSSSTHARRSHHSHHSHHSNHSNHHHQRTPTKSTNSRSTISATQDASELSALSVELVQIERHGKLTTTTTPTTSAAQSKYDLMTISNSNIPDNRRQCSAEPSNSSLDSNNNAHAHAQVKSAPDILPPTMSRPGPRKNT